MARRILVIDDSQDILDLFHALLDDVEYEVIGSDFVDARAIEQMQPDLLILDYLAGMQPVGGRIVAALRQHSATRHLPVIVCTTANMMKTAQEPALNTDGVVVVHKPFDVPLLLQIIEAALSSPSRMGGGDTVTY